MPRKSPSRPQATTASTITRHPATHESVLPTVSIVGPGRLGWALAVSLQGSGYKIDELVARLPGRFGTKAKKLGARNVSLERTSLAADIIWLTVSDSAIRTTADLLAARRDDWTSKVVFHSSGALTSDELAPFRDRGATVASVHPLMTFSGGTPADFRGVWMAVEGDAHGQRIAEQIVQRLSAITIHLNPEHKPAYHAWATFGSPLLIALLAAAERVAGAAGLDRVTSRRALMPLVVQTLHNYVAKGAEAAFTGPLVRGDVATVAKHLEALLPEPQARDAYIALARAALTFLPVGNASDIARTLNHPGSTQTLGRSSPSMAKKTPD